MSNFIVNLSEIRVSDIREISKSEETKDTVFKTDFEIRNMSVPLANALRRTFSTLCPTITFDDKYYDNQEYNSIKIINNTSSLHNEFVSHRLSLLPIGK